MPWNKSVDALENGDKRAFGEVGSIGISPGPSVGRNSHFIGLSRILSA